MQELQNRKHTFPKKNMLVSNQVQFFRQNCSLYKGAKGLSRDMWFGFIWQCPCAVSAPLQLPNNPAQHSAVYRAGLIFPLKSRHVKPSLQLMFFNYPLARVTKPRYRTTTFRMSPQGNGDVFWLQNPTGLMQLAGREDKGHHKVEEQQNKGKWLQIEE